jgi:hypothetical protein
MGGYIQQPALMLTTLQGLRALLDPPPATARSPSAATGS